MNQFRNIGSALEGVMQQAQLFHVIVNIISKLLGDN
jgi:hypothetical protein